MYVVSEATFGQAGVGTIGNGQLVASACLQNVTVTVSTLTTVSGTPTVALDVLLGDNQDPQYQPDTDTSWAIGAITTGLTVPTGANGSASVAISGCYRGLRLNSTWGTPEGTFKAQIAARDIN